VAYELCVQLLVSSTGTVAVAPRSLSPLVLACLAATWLVWGSTYLVIRFALVGFAPFFLMATRFVVAGAVLMGWQLARGAALPTAREWRNASLVGTLMLGGGMGGTAYAEQTIASGLVVAVIAVIPILLVVINLAFGVYPRRSELLAVMVGLAGVVMLTQGSGIHASPAGLLAIILGTSGWALGSVLSQRVFMLAPGATGFASELLCGGLALLVMSVLRGESWHLPAQPNAWAAWLYLVVFGTLIAFNAYMVLLARTSRRQLFAGESRRGPASGSHAGSRNRNRVGVAVRRHRPGRCGDLVRGAASSVTAVCRIG
jgi:drug/metabolite transporter (DMT)-like permease